jgi:hypothetical protein
MSGRNSCDGDLAVATLAFAREHEDEIFVRNPFLGSLGGFEPPAGRSFDAVVGLAPEVHEFYRVEKPEPTPHVRLRPRHHRDRPWRHSPGGRRRSDPRCCSRLRHHSDGAVGSSCPPIIVPLFDLRHSRGILSGSIGGPPAPYGRLSELLGRVLMLRASRREDRKRVPQYSSP